MIASALLVLFSALIAQPHTVVSANILVSVPKKYDRVALSPVSISAPEFDPLSILRNSEAFSRLAPWRVDFGRTAVGAGTRQDLANASDELQKVDILRANFRGKLPRHLICYRAKEDISRGAIVSHSNLERVACDDRATEVPVGYDLSHHVTRAAANATTGAYFGALSLPNSITRGEMTQVGFLLHIGLLTIERKVTLLQPSIDGLRAFVRDSEGIVFSIELAATAIVEAE